MKFKPNNLLNKGYQVFFLLAFSIIFIACAKGKNEIPETYFSSELGWKMEIVKGWEKMDSSQVAALTSRGISELKSQTGLDSVDMSTTKQLLHLQLSQNKLNKFTSSIDKQNITSEEEFNIYLDYILALLYDTFTGMNFKVEKIENPDVTIDGVKFKHITFKLSSSGDVLEQNLYVAYRNGYIFTVAIITTNEKYKKEIETAFLNSKFSK